MKMLKRREFLGSVLAGSVAAVSALGCSASRYAHHGLVTESSHDRYKYAVQLFHNANSRLCESSLPCYNPAAAFFDLPDKIYFDINWTDLFATVKDKIVLQYDIPMPADTNGRVIWKDAERLKTNLSADIEEIRYQGSGILRVKAVTYMAGCMYNPRTKTLRWATMGGFDEQA